MSLDHFESMFIKTGDDGTKEGLRNRRGKIIATGVSIGRGALALWKESHRDRRSETAGLRGPRKQLSEIKEGPLETGPGG